MCPKNMSKDNHLVIVITVLFSLLIQACSSSAKPSPLETFLNSDTKSMEFRQQYRYVDPVTEQATDYLSGWLAADPDKVEAETDFFADQQAYIRSMGAEFIARLQTAVKDAELTETDKPAQEEEINYMVRMEDGSMLYFYRNGYIKYLNGDERIIWSVDSDAYDALMQELDDYVPYWATEEFRQALLQSQ